MTVTATPSTASRSPLIEPEKTSSDKSLSTSPQPFTDLLTEATSKISLDGSDKPEVPNKKGESTKAIAIKDVKEENSGSHSKKSVVVDESTQLLPIIIAPVPLVMTEAAPVVRFATVRALKEPTSELTRVSTVATIDVKDSKLSATTADVDAAKHPSSNHLEAKESELSVIAPASSPHAVGLEDPHPKVIASIESDRVEIAKAVTPPDRSSTLPTRSANSVGNLVFAPELQASSPVATGSNLVAKPERSREPLIRGSAKPVEPRSEHASPILIRSEPEVLPVWPAHPVVVSGTDAVTAPSHITQPSPHSLDVGALAGAISRPVDEARGGYTVMIAMHPVELGHLQAVVTLHGSDLHVVITAQTHVGHNALTHAVETLKTELSRGGMNVNVTLQDPGSQPKGGDRAPEVPREVFTEEESVAIATAAPVPSTNQINLIL